MIDLFKALAEESRLRILALLLQDEMCVCEIEDCLDMNQSNVSRHLTALKRCGILQAFKKAQWVYYKIDNDFIEKNPELFAYLTKELKQLASYKSDCEILSKSKLQCLCDVKMK